MLELTLGDILLVGQKRSPQAAEEATGRLEKEEGVEHFNQEGRRANKRRPKKERLGEPGTTSGQIDDRGVCGPR